MNPTADELADADRSAARAAQRAVTTGTTRQRQRSGRWASPTALAPLVTADRGDLHAIAAAISRRLEIDHP